MPRQGSHRSGKSRGIFIYTLPNRHSTYGYGSLLKIAVKKDRKNLIEHPILYSEVFIYIHQGTKRITGQYSLLRTSALQEVLVRTGQHWSVYTREASEIFNLSGC